MFVSPLIFDLGSKKWSNKKMKALFRGSAEITKTILFMFRENFPLKFPGLDRKVKKRFRIYVLLKKFKN